MNAASSIGACEAHTWLHSRRSNAALHCTAASSRDDVGVCVCVCVCVCV
jgi:hypothetical protein